MCGILAVLGEPSAPLDEALGRLRHRGPDGQGQWAAPGIALGHVRLAVQDVEHGHQPMSNEDGSIWAVVNGELYGIERTSHFRTRSDSEAAIHLYERYGLDFVHQLRGEFAIVLWDSRRQRLVAVRDRFGIKPLCYTAAQDSLTLASEAKALFPTGWDLTSFLHAVTHQYLPPDRTLFEGISQVPPGHYLLAGRNGHHLVRYWDLDAPPTAGDLFDTLQESVRLRVQAD
ncbi:MAG TPA: asparagine synthetase B, partial [Candidatus Xenobia bacterium]